MTAPLTGLDRALALAREAEQRPPPDRRRALGLLARLLGPRDPRLADAADDLAWSAPAPTSDALAELVTQVEREGGRRMTSIPLADAGALRPAATRTLLVRIALAATLAGLVVAAALVSRHPHTETIVTLPAHSSAIVVLDVSASISADTYSRIGATLSSLARSDGRYGLVVFSDQAYEALPPGTGSQRSRAARALLHAASAFEAPEPRQTFPAESVAAHLQRRHEDLRGARARAPDRVRGPTQQADRDSRQRPRRRSRRICRGS